MKPADNTNFKKECDKWIAETTAQSGFDNPKSKI
jgi:hypothetical protein